MKDKTSFSEASLPLRKFPLAELYETVKWLYEPEFGDFKRKLGTYIDRTRETLDPSNREALKKLEQLKMQVVYVPNGDIEETRKMVLRELSELKMN